MILYGSKATSEAHSHSDLDLAILTQNTPNVDIFKKSYGEISQVFPGENVDVRFLNGADPLFGLGVVKNGILLYGNQNYLDELKSLINKRFIDDGKKYFPFRDQLLQEQQKRLETL